MNCKNCGQELPGASVMCRACGYKITSQGVGEWRNKRNQALKQRSNTRVQRATESTVIRFPQSERTTEAPDPLVETDLPLWRRQVKEKLRQVREQRQAEETAPHKSSRPAAESNPLVAAAIRRIRRDSTVTAQSSSGAATAQATARALERKEQPTLKPETHSSPPPNSARHSSAQATPAARTSAAIAAAPALAAPQQNETIPANKPRPSSDNHESVIAPQTKSDSEVTTPAPEIIGADETATEQAPAIHEHKPTGATLPTSHARNGKAPFLARIAAAVIDLEVIAFSLLPFFTAAIFFNVEFTRDTLTALAGLGLVMIFLYHLLTTAIAGRTCGMAVFRIRVADSNDESLAPTLKQSARRAFGAVLSLLFIPLNALVIALSPDRQSLSDQLSGTIVVRQ
jgi:uncharacterized RDD family membrane protein YckC